MGRHHLDALRELLPGGCAAYAGSEKNRRAVEQLGSPFFSGDLRRVVAEFRPSHAIVAVPVDHLGAVTSSLVELGIARILVEKPGVLDVDEGTRILERATSAGVRIWTGYNRRFYGSVLTAFETIHNSGETISSVAFGFTEWPERVEASDQTESAKRRWVLMNSMHPIDLALHAVGLPDPKRAVFYRSGSLSWHPSAAVMVGGGLTEKGVPFAYHADWTAPGGWGVEWMTASTRFVFRPLEQLFLQRRGCSELELALLAGDLDRRFKPGIYLQDTEFLKPEPSARLASFEHAVRLVGLAGRIAGY